MNEKLEQVVGLTREVLGNDYVQLRVERVTIEENVIDENTDISCSVIDDQTDSHTTIHGHGVGVIDALFNAVVARYADEYHSLKTIRFYSFAITAQLETKQAFSGSDSQAEVSIEIANSEDRLFSFSGRSRSVTSSAITTTLRGLEYFINSERAFLALYHALEDARQRNRADLEQQYTNSLALLVQNTSYSEVIERLRNQL